MKNNKKLLICIAICLILFFLLISVSVFPIISHKNRLNTALSPLNSTDYTDVFCADFPIQQFDETSFEYYLAEPTIKIEDVVKNQSDIVSVLKRSLSSNPDNITRFSIGITPVKSGLSPNLEKIIRDNPSIYFDMLLPFPSIHYWIALNNKELENTVNYYKNLVISLSQYENVSIFYVGNQEWLISNDSNYLSDDNLIISTAAEVLMHTYLCRENIITPSDIDNLLTDINTFIDNYLNSPEFNTDLSNSVIVLVGDSIFGNYTDETGIANVIHTLSGAKVYNVSKGGFNVRNNLPYVVHSLADFDFEIKGDYKKRLPYYTEREELKKADLQNSDLYFVINYGVNDYFCGFKIEEYKEAFRDSIKTLQDAYPSAKIILDVTAPIGHYKYGTMSMGENGSPLVTYRRATAEIAAQTGVTALDVSSEINLTKQTLELMTEDSVHLNYNGRFQLGRAIIKNILNIRK